MPKKSIKMTIEGCVYELERIRDLMDNKTFFNWYFHNFYTHGFLPVSSATARLEFRKYKKALDMAIEEFIDLEIEQ